MSKYVLGTHYNGKNFVNLLTNNLIREIERENKNHKSEIQIINNENFVVVRGYTTHQNPLNISQIFSKYYNTLFGLTKTFNVIDLIEYNTEPKNNHIYVNKEFKYDKLEENLIDKINKDTIKGLDYRFTANTDLDLVLIKGNTPIDDLKKYFENYTFYKLENPVETFVSDLYYGRNLKTSKLFEFYLNYITYNIFERGICKDLEISLFTDTEFNKINWQNIKINIKSKSLITSEKWLHSTILDLFTFEPDKIMEKWDLINYDFENEILVNENPIWKIKDRVGEMILL